MKFLSALLLMSLAGVGVALVLPGAADLLLLAGPCALASLYLLVRAFLRKPERRAQNSVVIDGSNVMHWKDGTPDIETVLQVVRHLKERGFSPGVVFDANAGYLIAGRYQHDGALSKRLGLPIDRVMVVNKGTSADSVILAAARDLGARIVTNDRYRDWADAHPEVRDPGHLIKGGYRDGVLWLDLHEASRPRTAAVA